MSISSDPLSGDAIVIDFLHNGEAHRTIRLTSDKGLVKEKEKYVASIKQLYDNLGREVTSVQIVERMMVCLDS